MDILNGGKKISWTHTGVSEMHLATELQETLLTPPFV